MRAMVRVQRRLGMKPIPSHIETKLSLDGSAHSRDCEGNERCPFHGMWSTHLLKTLLLVLVTAHAGIAGLSRRKGLKDNDVS